jgi:putative peptide zinc metalloprotease protein
LAWVSGSDALLIVVPLQLLQMLRHLMPMVRLDGYHILADLVGVPDLFRHIGPVLKGLLPNHWGRPENKVLRPWARAVVTVWVLLVVPLLTYTFIILIMVLPRLAATVWDSLGFRWTALRAAFEHAEIASMAAILLSMFALVLPVLSISYLLIRTTRRTIRKVWRATDGRPANRTFAVIVGAGLAGLLLFSWWPSGQYRPIAETEQGTLAVPFVDAQPAAAVSLPIQPSAPITPTASTTPPAANGPAQRQYLMLVEVPKDAIPLATAPTDGTVEPPWSSPIGAVRFNPPQPQEGDNFATVVNTTDGSVLTDAAVSLVFADGERVTNSNRAYALANCALCSTTAVAFQVVLITVDANVVIPDNLAIALNAGCNQCVTRALAVQLVVSLNGPLNAQAIAEINDIWTRTDGLQDRLATTSLDTIKQELLQVERDILAILEAHDAIASSTADDTTTDPTTDTTTTTSPEATTTTTTMPTSTTSTTPDATTSTTTPTTPTTTSTSSTTTTTMPDATTSTTTPSGP